MYYPHYKNGIRYTFTLQCPNLDHQLTLYLLHDATVRSDIHFYDVCKVADSVTIAFNNLWLWFEFDHGTESMEPFPLRPVNGWYTKIPRDWEIIQSFFDQYSLSPTWIDCNLIWGVFDEETGTWTGAVGKVGNCNLYIFIQLLFRLKLTRQTGHCPL